MNLHDEIERAVDEAITEINNADMPVHDKDFTREMVLLELDTEVIDDWEDWDEVDGLIDRVIERKLNDA